MIIFKLDVLSTLLGGPCYELTPNVRLADHILIKFKCEPTSNHPLANLAIGPSKTRSCALSPCRRIIPPQALSSCNYIECVVQ